MAETSPSSTPEDVTAAVLTAYGVAIAVFGFAASFYRPSAVSRQVWKFLSKGAEVGGLLVTVLGACVGLGAGITLGILAMIGLGGFVLLVVADRVILNIRAKRTTLLLNRSRAEHASD